jgi:tetratricopeptide (TPR) repeat protein
VASHLKFLGLLALAALFAGTGCGGDNFALSAETDEPLYRDGQQLEKEGRNQEALADYLKVIAKRGDTAPESHLEAGLIYLEHVEDPIAAIYHFRKCLELEPNSRQAAEVRGLIDTAKLNFARTLPAKPLENADTPADNSDEISQLRRENEELKAELAALRGGSAAPAASEPGPPPADAPPPAAASADEPAAAPITLAPLPRDGAEAGAPDAAAEPGGRTHTVVKGDTLFNIAQRYYGPHSGAKVRGIVEANSDQLSSASAPLKIGMVLKIP